MANLFDSDNYATTEPYEFTAGDRVAWKRTDLGTDYDNSLYTLTYEAKSDQAGSASVTITATASGSDYLIEILHSTTAGYTADGYHWDAYITRDSDSARVKVDSGTWIVKENLDGSTVDPRGHTQKVLEAIESVIEGRASKGQESLTVEGMTLVRTPIEDLLVLHSKYKAMYAQEKRAERARNGKKHSGKIYTRFA
jgi:hypothetical protein